MTLSLTKLVKLSPLPVLCNMVHGSYYKLLKLAFKKIKLEIDNMRMKQSRAVPISGNHFLQVLQSKTSFIGWSQLGLGTDIPTQPVGI